MVKALVLGGNPITNGKPREFESRPCQTNLLPPSFNTSVSFRCTIVSKQTSPPGLAFYSLMRYMFSKQYLRRNEEKNKIQGRKTGYILKLTRFIVSLIRATNHYLPANRSV